MKVFSIVCKTCSDSSRSHGNLSHHFLCSLNPNIEQSNFRVYSGFGQQLGPLILFNAAGVIDGLAAYYPKTVVRLFKLSGKRPLDDATLAEIQKLQFLVCSAEEFIVKNGILGIREGVLRCLKMGTTEGGRLPLRGRIADGEWEKWNEVHGRMEEIENSPT
jgi:2-keto-3-deoxy-L-rhamnonate aldolase